MVHESETKKQECDMNHTSLKLRMTRKLLILSTFLITPLLVSAATYLNKTSAPITISKKSICTQDDMIIDDAGINESRIYDTCVNGEFK